MFAVHRTAPRKRNYPAPNVNNGKAGNPAVGPTFSISLYFSAIELGQNHGNNEYDI